MITAPAEQVREAYKHLPVPIREFLVGDELGEVIQKLSTKYNLHVDTMGVLAEAISRMLLGFTSPEQLSEELTETLQLSPEVAKSFIGDLNTEMFMPLQKRVKEEGPGPTYEERLRQKAEEDAFEAPTVSEAPSTPPPAPVIPVMRIVAQEQEIPSNLPGQEMVMPPLAPFPPQPVAPQIPVMTAPQPQPAAVPAPIYSNPAPIAPVPTYQPAARTMERDMEYAQEHREQPTPAYQPPPAMPPQPYIPPPVQTPPQPPAPAPAPEPAAWNPQPTTAPVRLTPVDRAPTNAPITKEYGSDPYREPIE